ncbi:MAG: hypothetical protein JJU24_08305 [Natronohydrobacter sp.]|nr:hypothetical protein [Natronohydrobacter sp.]
MRRGITALSAALVAFWMQGAGLGAQSGLTLEDLGISPAQVPSPADRLRACFDDPGACSTAPRRGFSMDDVLNLGIVDHGGASGTSRSVNPVDQGPQPLRPPAMGIVDRGPANEPSDATRTPLDGAAGESAALTPTVLPSIDLSTYLSGDPPARNPRRSAELIELAAVLAEPVAQGLEVTLVVTGPDGHTTQTRASEIAQALERALGAVVRIETEPAEIDGLTLALSLPGS